MPPQACRVCFWGRAVVGDRLLEQVDGADFRWAPRVGCQWQLGRARCRDGRAATGKRALESGPCFDDLLGRGSRVVSERRHLQNEDDRR